MAKQKFIKHTKFIECPWCNPNAARENCSLCEGTGKTPHPDEQLCNLCGGPMCHQYTNEYGTWSADSPHGMYEQTVIGGYDSYHLSDMTAYTFSFCEECLRKLFLQCKIKPLITNLTFDSSPFVLVPEVGSKETPEWEKDLESYNYRIWKDTGGHHQAYLDKRCNHKQHCQNKAKFTVLCNGKFTENTACEEHKEYYEKYKFSYELVPFISNVLKPFL